MPEPDLDEIWKKRSELDEFKLRDKAYEAYERAYLARSEGNKGQSITWRPQMMDGGLSGTGDPEDRQLINLVRQINNHHQASFARPPLIRAIPYSPTEQEQAQKRTNLIRGVLRRSRIKAQQPLVSWRLTNRGDALLGLEWGMDNDSPYIQVRSYDPHACYPDLDKEDMGAMRDLLVVGEVRREWAEKTFNLKLGQEQTVRTFTYWTPTHRHYQIDRYQIPAPYTFEHGLGFVPWRWIFNSPNGFMAQSDAAEIPKLQGFLSDMFQLAMIAARRRVDKAYWGKGISGNVAPVPGTVIAFPNPNAQINEFPTADPPDMLLSMMAQIQQYAQGMGGISPISMEGMAQGSIVTGSAIRHQIEAIEARTETKRVSLEHGYGILGEYILRILEHAFPEQNFIVPTDRGEIRMQGKEVNAWYACEASYGGFEGMGPMERGRWAMEGLGRLHGIATAVSIAYPDADAETMAKEIDDYQIRQATITAQAQAAAQAAMGGGGAGGPGGPTGGAPGGPPGPGGAPGGQPPPPIQRMEPPQPPGAADVAQAGGQQMVKLGDLEGLINIVKPKLHGDVWAVGELAIAGQSAQPRVMVEAKEDEGIVNEALSSKNVTVTVGKPGKDEPKVSLK